jgi:hypothetical protein
MGVMAINCCNGCVPPKRYPGCKAHCPDYIIDNAFHQVEKEAERKRKSIQYGITTARSEAVSKALKSRRYSQKNYRRGSKSSQ